MPVGISQFSRFALATTLIATLHASLAGAAAPARLVLPNGITATVYDADYLAASMITVEGEPHVRLDDGRTFPVITDINDPSIYNKGDGTFHPFTVAMVETNLRALAHPTLALAVRVYLLPYPRRNVLASSTSGFEIFLSPHVLDIHPSTAGYIVTHELGHAFHNRFLPDGSAKWDVFKRLRGITDETRFSSTSPHAYRPKEILAEDFRALFGGADARLDGRIENTELAPPDAVAGLEHFLVRAATAEVAHLPRIAATSLPNPFNPDTEIRVGMPVEFAERRATVSVRVYSVTGALVRDLYRGEAAGDFAVRWDGTDENGNRVASATYYAAIQVGDARETVKLVLLK